eukprot:161906-Amphidinium_carterae.1
MPCHPQGGRCQVGECQQETRSGTTTCSILLSSTTATIVSNHVFQTLIEPNGYGCTFCDVLSESNMLAAGFPRHW